MAFSPRALAVGALAAVCAAGCSNEVSIGEKSLPPLLIEPLPLKVAVRYSPEVDAYRHEETVLGRQTWVIDMGGANRVMLDQLFDSMFREVVFIGEEQDPASTGADATVEASIDAFEFALPAQSRSKTYTVWIRYKLRVFDAEGVEIANWPVSAYGKAGSSAMMGSANKALQKAAVWAMRDAAALIGMRFARETGLGGPRETLVEDLSTEDEADEADDLETRAEIEENAEAGDSMAADALPPRENESATGNAGGETADAAGNPAAGGQAGPAEEATAGAATIEETGDE